MYEPPDQLRVISLPDTTTFACCGPLLGYIMALFETTELFNEYGYNIILADDVVFCMFVMNTSSFMGLLVEMVHGLKCTALCS